jgi:hypothetical protein
MQRRRHASHPKLSICRPRGRVASCQPRSREPRPAQGDERHRELPHGGPRRACGTLVTEAKETLAVARQPVDLETASLAVLTRCEYGRDIERRLAAQYPGYRDFIHQKVQRTFAEMQNTVKGNIAVIRTRSQATSLKPRRDARTDRQPDHEHHRRDRDGHERQHDLRRPMLAPNPTNDLEKLALAPRSLDYAVAGAGSKGYGVEAA